MKQKTKEKKNLKNSATMEIEKPKTICQKNCKVCNSPHLDLIHELRNNGKEFRQIIKQLELDYQEFLSASSLCRHFKNYRAGINLMSAQIIDNDMVDKATMQSVHLTKVVTLIDLALKSIENRMTTNSYMADIGELEKLMNMRYKLLTGEGDGDDLVALFQRASEDHGLQQAMIFRKPSEA
jgi:hypothetical protein